MSSSPDQKIIYDLNKIFEPARNLPVAMVSSFGQSVERDASSTDPFGETYAETGNIKKVTWPPLAQEVINFGELWWASLTPLGYFSTWLTSRFALRNGWQYVTHKKSKTPVENSLDKFLTNIEKDFDLKKIFQQADAVAKIFGRSLVALESEGANYYYSKPYLRVYAIRKIDIDYDPDTGSVNEYRPLVWKGNGTIVKHIRPENTVMFIWERDPNGNGLQGIPALFPIYRTIQQSENVSDAYSGLIIQRGMSGIDVEVKGADTEKKILPYAKKFGNWSKNSIFAHDENIIVKSLATINSGFNYSEVMEQYVKSVSSGTGNPSMRIVGVQTGAVTGSETDQDNQAENYAAEQEMFEPFMVQTIKLIAEKVYNRTVNNFEMDFDFDIKMDKSKLSQIFQTYSNAFGPVENLITVNQALTLLMYPPLEDDAQGNMILSEYNDQFVKEIEGEDPNNPPEDDDPDNPPVDEEEDEPEDKGNDSSLSKIDVAKKLIEQDFSHRDINKNLKMLFGSGLNFNKITALKQSHDSKRLILKTSKLTEVIFKIKREGRGLLINNIYLIKSTTDGHLIRQNKQTPIKVFVRDYLNQPTIDISTILTEEQT